MKRCYALIALSFLALSCTRNSIDTAPIEEGDFKIVLANAPTKAKSASRAFWDINLEGEECEREVNNITVYLYHSVTQTGITGLDTEVCLYRRDFAPSEIEPDGVNTPPTAIFSIPAGANADAAFDFYAVVNYKASVSNPLPTRAELLAYSQGDLASYMDLTVAAAPNWTGDFDKIYPSGPTSAAVALRNITTDGAYTGKGFAMSGMATVAKTAGYVGPRTVEIKVSRIVSKVQVKVATTTTFEDNYHLKFGSTLTINTVELINVHAKTNLFSGSLPATPAALINIVQTPYPLTGSTTAPDGNEYYANFYTFENQITGTTTAPTSKPMLRITATFDFDGDALTTGDKSEIVYEKEIGKITNGTLHRNAYYTIDTKINGLTPQEVVTTINIEDWTIVAKEDIEFGD